MVYSTTERNAFAHVFCNEVLIGHWVNGTKNQQRMWLEVLAEIKLELWNKM